MMKKSCEALRCPFPFIIYLKGQIISAESFFAPELIDLHLDLPGIILFVEI